MDKRSGHLALNPNISRSSRVMRTLLDKNVLLHPYLLSVILVHQHDISLYSFSVHVIVILMLAPRNRHDHLQIASSPFFFCNFLRTVLVSHTSLRSPTTTSPVVVLMPKGTPSSPHARQFPQINPPARLHFQRISSAVGKTLNFRGFFISVSRMPSCHHDRPRTSSTRIRLGDPRPHRMRHVHLHSPFLFDITANRPDHSQRRLNSSFRRPSCSSNFQLDRSQSSSALLVVYDTTFSYRFM